MRTKLLAATFGMFLAVGTAYAGPVPGGADSDSDGVEDAFDNCTAVANASQTDTDHDGCGDACSVDIRCDDAGNQSLAVDNPDFNILRMNFGKTDVSPGTLGDCNGDGSVTNTDFNILRMTFGKSRPGGTGPSGITTAQCNPARCGCTPQ